MQHSAELDYEELRTWLLDPDSDPHFCDPANLRLRDVWRGCRARSATPLELAVLLRQQAQRWALIGPSHALVTRGIANGITAEAVDAAGLLVVRDGDTDLISARRWEPEWLDNPADLPVDGSFAAGTSRGWRQYPSTLRADGVFTSATEYDYYKTSGQRAAVRVALESDPAGVVIANLPTGSGKTEVAVTLARSFETAGGGSCLVIVPTIALAQHLEARFRIQWQRFTSQDLSDVPFAWTTATNDDARTQLKQRIAMGVQPILVTSPESLNTALLATVRGAASSGRIRALIVDEAHLITQWGRGFRPEYRLLGTLWQELNGMSPVGIRALLLSATLPAEVVTDLVELFPTELGPAVVAANAVRTEPDFWVASPTDSATRRRRVLEAVSRLPRPCVLYVTQPKFAQYWVEQLREIGFMRVVAVTGESNPAARQAALVGLQTGVQPSKFDIVVGTSAFGLGIDVGEMRVVVHACMPETGDRWYQEVGRAGRDGYVSTAMLIPAHGDREEALALGVSILTPVIAAERWKALWDRRETRAGSTYINLRHSPRGKRDGSYNRRWNAQILDALQEQRLLTRRVLSFDEARSIDLPQRDRAEAAIVDAWQEIVLGGPPPDERFFGGGWVQWKQRLEEQSDEEIDVVERFIATRDACGAIESAYRPSEAVERLLGSDVARGFGVSVPCGRCQACAAAGFNASTEPSPEPTIRWNSPVSTSRFSEFVTSNQFALGPSADDQFEGISIVERGRTNLQGLAPVLVEAGVRLGAGMTFLSARAKFPYFDDVPDPLAMVPVPTVIALDTAHELRGLLEQLQLRWRRGRDAPEAVLVITPEVPRNLCATRQLRLDDLRKALEPR